jgi:DNA end-binding protein Ku
MWKGVLKLGEQSVPVKLYAAVEDADVHFHLLHADDEVRVQQRLVHPESGEAVPSDQVHKGYELERGTFVMLEPEEIAELAPPASRDIEVSAFVPTSAIAPAWFERPYHLGPDGQAAPAYQALARALESEDRQGIAHWTMRNKTYTGVLRAQDGALVLITLRDREEVIAAPKITPASSRAATKPELALAEQLVSSLAGDLDLSQFHNEYRERVREFVEQKARGKAPRLAQPKTRKATGDALLTALRASVKQARSGGAGTRKAHPQQAQKERKSA